MRPTSVRVEFSIHGFHRKTTVGIVFCSTRSNHDAMRSSTQFFLFFRYPQLLVATVAKNLALLHSGSIDFQPTTLHCPLNSFCTRQRTHSLYQTDASNGLVD